MTSDSIPPDPDSLARWQQLPQNAPSREALPPMTGGVRWVSGLLIIITIVILFGLLQGHG